MSFLEHTRKTQGFVSKIMVAMMISGHNVMAEWGLSHICLCPDMAVCDSRESVKK